MNVGELFVSLGVKGADKTVGALTSVSKGMGDIKHMSLEAKAGILAALYGLERLFAASGQAGTGLTNFNALLGVSAQTLQKYQYAARQMGVANQDVEASFKGLQSTMTKTLMGEGAPKGLARLAMLTGGITPEDINQFAKSPELLMQRLQQYALKEKNVGLRNEVLKSFNISDAMIAAMSRNAFTPESLGKAPVYGDKEIESLNRSNIAWSNLGVKIEMAVGKFNSMHGGTLVRDIDKITTALIKLTGQLILLADKWKIFEALSKVMNFLGDAAAAKPGTVLGEKHLEKKGLDWLMNAITPFAGESAGAGGGNQNLTVNQNLNFQHDGTDHKKTGESVKKAVRDAYRQIPSQGQGS